MARLFGPVGGQQLGYQIRADNALATAGGLTATVYADAAGTQLANILTYPAGAAIPGSQLTLTSGSLLPLFQFPDGADTVYVSVNGGPVVPVYAKGSTTNLSYRGAWAASTAYAVNDLVTLGGEELLCQTAHTSAASFSLTNWTNLTGKPGQFNVMLYGAKGDGATDDTAAINSAISAAVSAGQANGTNYAEIVLPPAVYVLSSATTKSASNKGNAQIWLPLIAATAQKFTLVLRGTRTATALPHWQQTNVQRGGAVLKTTLTGQTVDGTFGPPSVVGGPTPAQGYGYAGGSGVFNNMLIVLDGVSVVTPANPTMLGYDFSGMAQVNVISASANASTTPGSGLPALCTNSWAYGIYMPQMLNNDLCNIQDFSVEGFYSGLTLAEHAVVTSCRAIYCQVGITIVGDSSDSIWIGYASVEACPNVLQNARITTGFGINVMIDLLDVEDTNSAPFTYVNTIDDSTNSLHGVVNVHELSGALTVGADPVVNGASNLRVINLGRKPGNVTAPGVPSSTTPLTNPFFRDAMVVVTGGTVSAVSVDGVAQGYTATPFTVIVPSGKTITLTYSAAPSWKWTLL